MRIEIGTDDPRRPDVVALIEEHLADMRAWSPPGAMHALDLDGLVAPGMTFWTARRPAQPDGELLGMAATKDLGDGTGELKSMRSANAARGTGVGRLLLGHVIASANERGWRALRLETGLQPEFEAARAFYRAHGFEPTGPFAQYADDPASAFMRLDLGA